MDLWQVGGPARAGGPLGWASLILAGLFHAGLLIGDLDLHLVRPLRQATPVVRLTLVDWTPATVSEPQQVLSAVTEPTALPSPLFPPEPSEQPDQPESDPVATQAVPVSESAPAPAAKAPARRAPPPKTATAAAAKRPRPPAKPLPSHQTVAVEASPASAAPPALAERQAPAVTQAVDLAAAYRNNPQPAYPRLARRLRQQGEVLLWLRVAADGSVDDARIKQGSGSDLLDQAALAAVRKWRFDPARRLGTAVESEVTVPIRFRLR